jgi:hypothetical protein
VFEGGAAFTSQPEVRLAVTKVCGIRRVNKGTVTSLLDKVYATNCANAALRCESKRVEGIEEQKRKDAAKGVRFNNALKKETLAENEQALEAHLEMLGHAKGMSQSPLLCPIPKPTTHDLPLPPTKGV